MKSQNPVTIYKEQQETTYTQYTGQTMKQLTGLTLDELRQVATEAGLPAFTGRQIADWLYKKHATSIDEMTNLSLTGRERLKSEYEVGRSAPVWSAHSTDGTNKYLFNTAHGQIETVFIPEEDRGTLCVSCQVGCKMNCLFCMTGKQGWSGDLTAGEIINQLASVPERDRLTNVVFMGMGEPFDNIDAVIDACKILTADWGWGWSPKRITVSSVGLLPGLKRFLAETECHLAISLHNSIPEERLRLMPAEQAYSIADILKEIKKHDWEHQRRVSFEYIVFEGVNDSMRHSAELVRQLRGFTCRVNLIRFHSIPGTELHSPNEEDMIRMRDYLTDNGIICTIRRSRGEDILAACGLLSSNYKHNNA